MSYNTIDNSQWYLEKEHKGNFEDFLSKLSYNGADITLSRKILESRDYMDFMSEINYLMGNSKDQDEIDPKYAQISSMRDSEYDKIKTELISGLTEYLDISREASISKIDYRKLLNGNDRNAFLNKDLLTDEDKYYHNVHGLMNEQYDIYFQNVNGAIMTKTIYYDFGTKNDGWVQMSSILKKLSEIHGTYINHKTPLIVTQRELLAVDPWEVQTNDMKKMVAQECRINPYYFLRECQKVKELTKLRPYVPSIGSWSLIWLHSQCFNTYIERSRQTGKTFDVLAILGYEFVVGSRDKTILLFNYIESQIHKNKNELITIIQNIPNYLKTQNYEKNGSKSKEELGPNGVKEILNNITKNKLKIKAIGTTETSGQRAGRGETITFANKDEVNFYTNIPYVMTSVSNGHNTASALAEARGERYGLILTSTAGDRKSKHGKFMYNFIYNEMTMFDTQLFSYTREELAVYLNRKLNAKHYFVIKYSYKELGLSEDWVEKAKRANNSSAEFQVEILNMWLADTAGVYLSEGALIKIESLLQFNKPKLYIHKKIYDIKYFANNNESFETLIQNTPVIIMGIDLASGDLGDSSVIYAMNAITGKRIYTFASNNIYVDSFADFYMELVDLIYSLNPKCKIITNVERNDLGRSFIPIIVNIDKLKTDKYMKTLFYTTEIVDKTAKKAEEGTLRTTDYQVTTKRLSEYGTFVNAVNREYLTETLYPEIADKYPYLIADEDLYNEAVNISMIRGKVQANKGFHDDYTFAMLHCASLIHYHKYREILKNEFDFIVDRTKILNMSSNVFVLETKEPDPTDNIDGKYEFRTVRIKHDDCIGGYYEIIEGDRWQNGLRQPLTPEELQELTYTNEELRVLMGSIRVFGRVKKKLQNGAPNPGAISEEYLKTNMTSAGDYYPGLGMEVLNQQHTNPDAYNSNSPVANFNRFNNKPVNAVGKVASLKSFLKR